MENITSTQMQVSAEYNKVSEFVIDMVNITEEDVW
jgi:hypothetical protein